MSNTESIPSGLYHIVLAQLGHIGNERLSRQGGKLTLLPAGAVPDADQVWRIQKTPDGNLIIERPALIFPPIFLTYEGAPQKPKQGAPVLLRPSDFPLNEWHLALAPGFSSNIRVAGSDLGISPSPHPLNPPSLVLSAEHQLHWMFSRVSE